MELTDIATVLENEIGSSFSEKILENATPPGLQLNSTELLQVCEVLHKNQSCYFDLLSCLTGVDNGPEKGTMEVIYNLTSIPFNYQLTLKVELERENPTIPSVAGIWKTANWHEREAFDLFGINFEGHPDLRRILLPANWEGHPLKKDYQTQEYYHGIKVDFEE